MSRRDARAALPFMLGTCGLFITLFVQFLPHPSPGTSAVQALGWLAGGAAVGFLLRALRRIAFFAPDSTIGQAVSIEALLQGIHLLNPFLAWPAVERELVRRETGCSRARVEPWFAVRTISAVTIPTGLAAAVFAVGGLRPWAIACAAIAVVSVCIGSVRASREIRVRTRLVIGVLLGAAAAAAEAYAFVQAASLVSSSTSPWVAVLVYLVTLAAFELTCVPMAFGVIELAYGALMLVPGLALPGFWVASVYRFVRGGPVLLASLFGLMRYELSVWDLYDERLPRALARTRRPEGGWPEEEAAGPRLSIVIPAYNEEGRPPTFLYEVCDFARELPGGAEVLVVDDGSVDATADRVEAIAQGQSVLRLVRQAVNQGKGAAVRRGVLEARGRLVLFADADGATPIREVERMLPVAESGTEVVIASRRIEAEGEERERSAFRDLLGLVFHRLIDLLAAPGISGPRRGFMLLRRGAARRIFEEVQERDWAFDVEVLFLARKYGFEIREVGVDRHAIDGSNLRPVRDAIRMFFAILRIRRRCAGLVDSLVAGR